MMASCWSCRLVAVAAVALLALVGTVRGDRGEPTEALGDYVCTEMLKQSFSTMFIRHDVVSTVEDSLALCDECRHISRLAFLFVNDDKYSKAFKHNARDNACKYTARHREKDCHSLADAILNSQESFFKSAAAKFSPEERTVAGAYADAVETRAQSLCQKVACCRATQQQQGNGTQAAKPGEASPQQQQTGTKDKKEPGGEALVQPKGNNGTAGAGNGTVNGNSTANGNATHTPSAYNKSMTPSEMAKMDADRRAERLARDKLNVERGIRAIQHARDMLEMDRSDFAKKAKLILEKEKKIDEAVHTGRINCSDAQLKAVQANMTEKANKQKANTTTTATSPGATAALKPAESAATGTGAAAGTTGGATGTAPAAGATGPAAGTAPAVTTSGDDKKVTPVTKFREDLNLADLRAQISQANNMMIPGALQPAAAPGAPPLPPGYTWHYRVVED